MWVIWVKGYNIHSCLHRPERELSNNRMDRNTHWWKANFFFVISVGPKSISLSPAIYLYVVSEDNDINIPICIAICSPDCNYTWTGPNGFREHYYSLQLNSVNRTQSGLYMCQAKNDYGSKTSDSINIIVNCE